MRINAEPSGGRDRGRSGEIGVSAASIEVKTDASPRVRWKRGRLIFIALIAVLAAAGALAAWGPIGVGPGPIGNGRSNVAVGGPVPRTQPAWFVVPIDAGHSGAVIDGIEVLSDGSYPAPRVISIKGNADQSCAGAWPVAGPQNFYAACVA